MEALKEKAINKYRDLKEEESKAKREQEKIGIER